MTILLDRAARVVIGHRGAAGLAPENTLAGFALARELGVDALELDVHRSADDEAIVIHDPTLERTTDRAGRVAQLTVAQLQQANAGFRFRDAAGTHPGRDRDLRVPTLRQVIEAFPSMPLLIEIKEVAAQPVVARVLRETGAAARAVVAGDDWRALAEFRADPFVLGACRRDAMRLYFRWREPDPRCRCYSLPERYYRLPVPTRRMVRAAHRRGATMHVWTVDDPAVAERHWAHGVNGIVTNRPDLIVPARQLRAGQS